MKKIILILRKIVVAICMLYAFNLIISKSGYMVSINTPSIALTAILGLPAIISLLVLKMILK